jgi:hypothetical protein
LRAESSGGQPGERGVQFFGASPVVGTALAATRGETKVVRYRGYSVVVPAGWPVYNLAANPTVCVRV